MTPYISKQLIIEPDVPPPLPSSHDSVITDTILPLEQLNFLKTTFEYDFTTFAGQWAKTTGTMRSKFGTNVRDDLFY